MHTYALPSCRPGPVEADAGLRLGLLHMGLHLSRHPLCHRDPPAVFHGGGSVSRGRRDPLRFRSATGRASRWAPLALGGRRGRAPAWGRKRGSGVGRAMGAFRTGCPDHCHRAPLDGAHRLAFWRGPPPLQRVDGGAPVGSPGCGPPGQLGPRGGPRVGKGSWAA